MVSLVVSGSTVDLEAAALPQLYEGLWIVAVEQRGAVVAAARLRHLIVYKGKPNPVTFEGDEATAVRAALDRIGHQEANADGP